VFPLASDAGSRFGGSLLEQLMDVKKIPYPKIPPNHTKNSRACAAENHPCSWEFTRWTEKLPAYAHWHARPRIASIPSRTTRGRMTSAATGSAHLKCPTEFSTMPIRAMIER